MRRRPWYAPVTATSRSVTSSTGIARDERGRVAVRAEAEVDEVEARPAARRRSRPRPPRGRAPRRASARTSAAPPGGQAREQVREVAVGVAVGRDALVDLVDRHLLPRHPSPCEVGEHRPRRVSAADRERERARVRRPLRGRARRRTLGAALGDRLGVGEDLDRRASLYAVFSSWPPNSLRIAERSLSRSRRGRARRSASRARS